MSIKTAQEINEIAADGASVGLRLDVFLSKSLQQISRAQLTKLIKSGQVTLNGRTVKPSYAIMGHENFAICWPRPAASHMAAEALPLDILYSDEHIAIINKPAGLAVHPGAGVAVGTLCNALLFHFPNMEVGSTERPGIVHRLDKNTSGIMIVAKTTEAHRILSDDFKHRRIKKIYRAYCCGEIDQTQFELKTGHARHPYNRLKFLTKIPAPKMPSTNIRVAHTSFSIRHRRFGISEVIATLHTGRTHQIRAHLADIDHPLVGDELYGGKRALSKTMPDTLKTAILSLPGQALHAESLEFSHPITNLQLSFRAALPEQLQIIADFFNE